MPTTSREFSTPTLVGDRFETGAPSLPLDALADGHPEGLCRRAAGAVRREDDVEDVESRLKELEELEHGWLDGEEGEVPSKEGLGWLRGILLALVASYEVPLPYLYPTPEGGVQAEWSFKPWEVSAEFNLLKRAAYLHAVKGKTRETEVDEVHFEEDEDIALKRTAEFVLRLKERGAQA